MAKSIQSFLTATNKARGKLYFIKRSFTCLTKEIYVPLYTGLVRPNLEYAFQTNCMYLKEDINHLERIQRAAKRWMKGYRGLMYQEWPKVLKLLRLRNDLVMEHKILNKQIYLEAANLFRFSQRLVLRRSSIRLLHETG